MSGEHLWSDWMGPLLPTGTHRLEELLNYTPAPGRRLREQRARTREGAPHTVKIEVVCQDCNSGWMNRLEEQARPYIAPMIKGQFVALDEVARGIAARWIVLKVLVLEQQRPIGTKASAIHTKGAYQDFMTFSHIPDGFKVWIGHSEIMGAWGSSFSRYIGGLSVYQGDLPPKTLKTPGHPPNSQTITWGIGHLRVFAVSTTDLDVHDAVRWNLPHFLPLWPIAEGDMVWPPPLRVTDQDMIELKELVLRFTENGARRLA